MNLKAATRFWDSPCAARCPHAQKTSPLPPAVQGLILERNHVSMPRNSIPQPFLRLFAEGRATGSAAGPTRPSRRCQRHPEEVRRGKAFVREPGGDDRGERLGRHRECCEYGRRTSRSPPRRCSTLPRGPASIRVPRDRSINPKRRNIEYMSRGHADPSLIRRLVVVSQLQLGAGRHKSGVGSRDLCPRLD